MSEIDPYPLPKKCRNWPATYRSKAKRVLRLLSDTPHRYREAGGKRLKHDRKIISVPIGKHYRMLFRELDDGYFDFVKACTHSEYNCTKPGA